MIPIAPVVYASSFSPDARAIYKLVTHHVNTSFLTHLFDDNTFDQYTLNTCCHLTHLSPSLCITPLTPPLPSLIHSQDTEAETNKWRAAITAGSKGRLSTNDTATAAQLDNWQHGLRSPPLLPTSPHRTYDPTGHDSPTPSNTHNTHLRDVAFADAVEHYVPREQSPIPPQLALATRVADAAIVAAVKDITTNAVALMQAATTTAPTTTMTTTTASRNTPTDSGNDEMRGDASGGHDNNADNGDGDHHNINSDQHHHHETHDPQASPFGQPGVRPRVRLTHRPSSAPSARGTPSVARFNASAMGTKVITDALDGTGGVEG